MNPAERELTLSLSGHVQLSSDSAEPHFSHWSFWLPAGLDSFSVFFQILVQALPTQERVSLELFLQPLQDWCCPALLLQPQWRSTSASSDTSGSLGATETTQPTQRQGLH